jgi:hypothetical protein
MTAPVENELREEIFDLRETLNQTRSLVAALKEALGVEVGTRILIDPECPPHQSCEERPHLDRCKVCWRKHYTMLFLGDI